MIIHEFYSDIYPIQFWVLINPSREQIDNTFEPKDENTTNSILDDGWVACTSVMNVKKDTRKYGVYVAILRPDKMTVGALAHEACHAVDRIYSHIGADCVDIGGEPHAYFVEWIVRCIDEAIQDNKKENKMNKLKCGGGKTKPPKKK